MEGVIPDAATPATSTPPATPLDEVQKGVAAEPELEKEPAAAAPDKPAAKAAEAVEKAPAFANEFHHRVDLAAREGNFEEVARLTSLASLT